jgi:NADH-quinone oxidoreductase subunit K
MTPTPQILYWSHYIAASMFGLGLVGFLIRRNAIVVLMCLELMLNAANLLLVEGAVRTGTPDGILMVVFVITVAAAEVAIGLGIVLNLYRLKGTVELDAFRNLQG